MAGKKAHAVRRIDGQDHGGILRQMPESGDRDGGKPDQHDRAEEGRNFRRAARLDGKESRTRITTVKGTT